MIFNDINKYNINDLLKIETLNKVYQGYIYDKYTNNLTLQIVYPTRILERYNINDNELSIEHGIKIISIELIDKDDFNINNKIILNKHNLIKNNLYNEFKIYDNIIGTIINISNLSNLNEPFPIRCKFNENENVFNYTELDFNLSKNMYKPRKRIYENTIIKYNDFNYEH